MSNLVTRTWLELRRKDALGKTRHQVMQSYLAQPFPNQDQRVATLELVSLDLETTGLDPKKDRIISFGLVPVQQGAIRLDQARHEIVRFDGDMPASAAVIHGITDDKVAAGKPLDDLLPQLLGLLAGKVMLVHYAAVEQKFLDAACKRLYGSPFLCVTVDTLKLAHRLLSGRNQFIQSRNLRLFNLRQLFGLPQYQAHDALNDALATAELFLALMAELSPANNYRLKDITI